jgi:hypothetical protein
MPKFRKIPVVIEAIQWTGDNLGEIQLMGAAVSPANTSDLLIATLEDGPDSQVLHYANKGDWIIRGVQGEFYPCKPDIFAKTYEPV